MGMRSAVVPERHWLRELRGNDLSLRQFLAGTEFEGQSGYISQLETGRKTPGLTMIKPLARLSGVEPLWLAEKFLEELP